MVIVFTDIVVRTEYSSVSPCRWWCRPSWHRGRGTSDPPASGDNKKTGTARDAGGSHDAIDHQRKKKGGWGSLSPYISPPFSEKNTSMAWAVLAFVVWRTQDACPEHHHHHHRRPDRCSAVYSSTSPRTRIWSRETGLGYISNSRKCILKKGCALH